MKKKPWMKFYPSDWLGDVGLRSCSAAARGIWMDMLCLMHQSEPIGYLRTGDSLIQMDNLAHILCLTKKRLLSLINELQKANVLSLETTTNCIYSRRMVHDENISLTRQAVGKLGGNPDLLNQNLGISLTPESKDQSPEKGKKKKVPKKTVDILAIPLPENLPLAAWQDWVAYRKQKKSPLTPMTAERQLKMLSESPYPVLVIEKAIRNGWTGMFHLKPEDLPGEDQRPVQAYGGRD